MEEKTARYVVRALACVMLILAAIPILAYMQQMLHPKDLELGAVLLLAFMLLSIPYALSAIMLFLFQARVFAQVLFAFVVWIAIMWFIGLLVLVPGYGLSLFTSILFVWLLLSLLLFAASLSGVLLLNNPAVKALFVKRASTAAASNSPEVRS